MKLTSLIPFVLYASLASAKVKKPKGSGGSSEEEETTAADQTATATETQDVGEIISSFYSVVPTIAPSASTGLASNLLFIQSSWYASPEYTSAGSAIDRFLPASLSSSVSVSGYYFEEIMTQSWFTKSVPTDVQTAVVEYVSKMNSVNDRFVATATGAGSVATKVAGSGAVNTGVPLGVVGIVGVVGGVFAAVL